MQRHLLIIEDDPGLQSQMRWCVEDAEVATADSADTAIAEIRRQPPQVVTLDLGLPPDPGGTSVGFELLRTIKELSPRSKVIVITGREEQVHALEAIAGGADDYYQKPIDGDALSFVVARAFRLWELEAENRRLAEATPSAPLQGIIAASASMLEVCRTVERVAATDATVLILGETGTGKELIARALHDLSDRADAPFVAINCAAIPENLLESELFGHEKGAFTGAVRRKIGKIENAMGGTLFLDEIGDMPLALQAKILRFLQERVIERVGGHTSIEVDVRVISATHRDVDEAIATQEFREDLYYRISEISIAIPPLRKRNGDAMLLANAFIQRFAPDRSMTLSADASHAIETWNWSGNVRELENRIKRACIMCEDMRIYAADLELAPPGESQPALPLNLKDAREAAERDAVIRALAHCQSNLAKASRLLGISRPTLYNLLKKFQLDGHAESQGTTD
jgi:two-component system NtrC family response regulator